MSLIVGLWAGGGEFFIRLCRPCYSYARTYIRWLFDIYIYVRMVARFSYVMLVEGYGVRLYRLSYAGELYIYIYIYMTYCFMSGAITF